MPDQPSAPPPEDEPSLSDEEPEELSRREAAEAEEEARAEAAKAAQPPSTQQTQEWLRQSNVIYAGLLGAAFIIVQPFLTTASLDVSGKICVVAFAVAIPLLAALLLVGQQEFFKRRWTFLVQANDQLVRQGLSALFRRAEASRGAACAPEEPPSDAPPVASRARSSERDRR
jgi:hypothetical protein